MRNAIRTARVLAGCAVLLGAAAAPAQDWPQWRGPNRDNHVTGFTEPSASRKTVSSLPIAAAERLPGR